MIVEDSYLSFNKQINYYLLFNNALTSSVILVNWLMTLLSMNITSAVTKQENIDLIVTKLLGRPVCKNIKKRLIDI